MRRVIGVFHERALCNCTRDPLQWAALKAMDVRLSLPTRGDNHHAHLVVLRASYKGARFSSKFRLAHFTFIARNSPGFSLCASVLLSSLCDTLRAALLFWSCLCSARLCSARLSSARICSTRLCSSRLCLGSRLCFSLVAPDSNIMRSIGQQFALLSEDNDVRFVCSASKISYFWHQQSLEINNNNKHHTTWLYS